MSETIKLKDFLEDVCKSFELEEVPKPVVKIFHVCDKCDEWYPEGTKFCSKDGAKVVEDKNEVEHEDYRSYAGDTFSDFEDGCKVPEDFPYDYVGSVEKRHPDNGKFCNNYIFKRKSDDKFFYYSSYDYSADSNTLDECAKEETIVWDFERFFS